MPEKATFATQIPENVYNAVKKGLSLLISVSKRLDRAILDKLSLTKRADLSSFETVSFT
jgi:hypothetical protein